MAEDTSFTHYNTVMDILLTECEVVVVTVRCECSVKKSRQTSTYQISLFMLVLFFHLTSITKHTIKYENNCCNIVGLSMENSARNRNMTWPDIPLFGICLKDLIFYSIDPFSTMLFDVLFTITRKWNCDKCSSKDE